MNVLTKRIEKYFWCKYNFRNIARLLIISFFEEKVETKHGSKIISFVFYLGFCWELPSIQENVWYSFEACNDCGWTITSGGDTFVIGSVRNRAGDSESWRSLSIIAGEILSSLNKLFSGSRYVQLLNFFIKLKLRKKLN